MATTLLNPYVTLDDVKFYCGISLTKTEFDEDIRIAINKTSKLVDMLTGRYYYKKTYTDYYINDIAGGNEGWEVIRYDNSWERRQRVIRGVIFTPKGAPIISITSLYEDDNLLTDNTDYYTDDADGVIQKASGNWTTDNRTIKITCDLGYDSADSATPSADIPGDIAFHSMEIAARLSGHYKKSVRNFVAGSVEEMELFGIPKATAGYLMNYRPVRIL